MDAEVEQALGDVERAHPVGDLLAPRREHELVHARAVEGQVVDVAAAGAHVVGVQDGRFAQSCAGQRRRACGCRCSRAPGCRSGPESPSAGRCSWADRSRARSCRRRAGRRPARAETGSRRSLTTTGPAPGPPRAVRRRKRLVDVDVQAVEAHLGRLDDAQNGVQVGAVAVDQAARRDGRRRSPRAAAFRTGRACWGWSASGRRRVSSSSASQLDQVDVAVGVGRDRDACESRTSRRWPDWCRAPSRAPAPCGGRVSPRSRW